MQGGGWYAGRRMAQAVPTLLCLSFAVFAIGTLGPDPSGIIAARNLEPGLTPTPDQVAVVHHSLGLDRPITVRYIEWLGKTVHGNLGQSVLTGQRVSDAITKAFPATFTMALLATAIVLTFALPVALAGAMLFGRWFQQVIRVIALTGASIPGFFLAYLLIYLFAVQLHAFPVAGQVGFRSAVLPALTIAIGPTARVSRLLQSSIVDQFGADYLRTARAKGLTEVATVLNHAVRNAFLPTFTVLGGVLAGLMEGAVVVETIFGRSGIGALTLSAVGSGDYPMIQGVVLLAGLAVIGVNLLVDLCFPLLDSRVRLGAVS